MNYPGPLTNERMMLIALEKCIAIKGKPIPPVGASPYSRSARKARIGSMRRYTLNPSLRFVPFVPIGSDAPPVSDSEVEP